MKYARIRLDLFGAALLAMCGCSPTAVPETAASAPLSLDRPPPPSIGTVDEPLPAAEPSAALVMGRESHRAIQIGLRNLTDRPLTLAVATATSSRRFPTMRMACQSRHSSTPTMRRGAGLGASMTAF